MNNSKIKINNRLKGFFYLLLVISVIIFLIKFYKITSILSVIILITLYVMLFFISGYLQSLIRPNYNIKKITFIKIDLIILFVLNTLIYCFTYNLFYIPAYNIILYFIIGLTFMIGLTIVLNRHFLKPVIILIKTGLIVIFISYIIGTLTSTDFSLTAFVFLFGLVFTITENIEEFINLEDYYPEKITTIKNDGIIKRNKVLLNLTIGILFMLSYIILKLLTIQDIRDNILELTKLNELNKNVGIGLLIIIANELLIITFLLISTRILEKISNHTKKYDNQTIVGLMYSILTFGIKENTLPKVVKEIAIGNKDIDQINPEVFIENIKEVPKDIHILLSKVEDIPTVRNLLIIYPNKDVYICKFSISKTIVKRISKVKLANTVNK